MARGLLRSKECTIRSDGVWNGKDRTQHRALIGGTGATTVTAHDSRIDYSWADDKNLDRHGGVEPYKAYIGAWPQSFHPHGISVSSGER